MWVFVLAEDCASLEHANQQRKYSVVYKLFTSLFEFRLIGIHNIIFGFERQCEPVQRSVGGSGRGHFRHGWRLVLRVGIWKG